MYGARQQGEAEYRAKYAELLPLLDERSRRAVLGADARMLGRGGATMVARAAGVARRTVTAGIAEFEGRRERPRPGRIRRPGAGRPRVEDQPGLVEDLLKLVEGTRRGDPMSALSWTTLSTRHLAAELRKLGYRIKHDAVGRLLRDNGFSLQANAKMIEGSNHPDRDAQFGHINALIAEYLAAGDPVVSVDTKKKELVGNYKNNGREWSPKGEATRVNVHDFRGPGGKANPYGIYDLATNTGFVNVGVDHDTPAFAVNSLRRWWQSTGRATYPGARRLLITADGGGSNSYRARAWKSELAAFAAETGLTITVTHLPPGTSKWNKIEHRLFGPISINWRGRPLTSLDVIINTIKATTTTTGLTVEAVLDEGVYPTGATLTKKQMQHLAETGTWVPHDWHGEWNYTINPAPQHAAETGDPAGTTAKIA